MISVYGKYLVSSIFFLMSLTGISLNILLFITLINGHFLRRKSPDAIYYLTASEMLADQIYHIINLFYFVPACVLQKPLVSDDMVYIFTNVMGCAWYTSSIMKASTAINRFCAICLGIFQSSTCAIYAFAFLPWLLSIFVVAAAFVTPCCPLMLDYSSFGMGLTPADRGHFNYADMFLKIPVNIIISVIIVFCYISVFVKIIYMNKVAAAGVTNTMANQRRSREIHYAIQFSLIAAIYIFSWILIRFFPSSLKDPLFHSLRTIPHILNFMTLSISTFTLNVAVRKRALCLLRGEPGTVRCNAERQIPTTATTKI